MDKNPDIKKWVRWFNAVNQKYEESTQIIGRMIKQKNMLNANNERQDSDDLMFYKSILFDSIYFFKKSLKVRRMKFINDISTLNKYFDKDRMSLDDVNKPIYWGMLNDYYNEMNIKNLQDLQWIKDDMLVSLIEWKKDLNYILNYHYYIINNFCTTLENEVSFYENTGEINLIDIMETELTTTTKKKQTPTTTVLTKTNDTKLTKKTSPTEEDKKTTDDKGDKNMKEEPQIKIDITKSKK